MSDISASTGKLLALSMLSGVGPVSLRKASLILGFEVKAVEAIGVEVAKIGSAISQPGAWTKALELAEEQLDLTERCGARILSPLDDEYSKLLAATKDDPFLLWVRGELASSPEKSVAIIGTREPTPHGEVIAKRITQFFVEQKWSVVSGLALGCDAIAHRSAMEANGHTVAVLAHGLHTIAPTQHRRLAEEILEKGGALVSQYPVGRDAIPQQFVQRDKTQAGLAQGVVMVQSDHRGGSMHASRAAIEYGRWLAVPMPTDTDRAAKAPKIEANLTLAEGSDSERVELLHAKDPTAIRKIIVLRSRDDYAKCLQEKADPVQAPTVQGSIF